MLSSTTIQRSFRQSIPNGPRHVPTVNTVEAVKVRVGIMGVSLGPTPHYIGFDSDSPQEEIPFYLMEVYVLPPLSTDNLSLGTEFTFYPV